MSKKTSSQNGPAITVGLRRYLYLTAAVTGAAIMIIEILGAKMLSPYVGTSHFVWTAQIAVTLIALATGYYVGGRFADGSTRLAWLYNCILAAAVYLALCISVVEPLAYWCLQFQLALGSLLASAGLFFVPLALLATTGPFLVRVLTSSLVNVGGNAGRLTAVSTLGSFAGTILIGYVLVPLLPNSLTMFLTAGSLLVLVVAYFVLWGRRAGGGSGIAVGVLLAVLLGLGGLRRDALVTYANADQVFRGNSNFGLLQVIENRSRTRRMYLNDFLTQNTFEPATKQSLSLFTYMLHGLSRAYSPRTDRVLCIGLGVGIVPMLAARDGAKVDVVEINPAVVPVASRYFDFQAERVQLHLGDGRWFLNRAAAGRYDTILLDAFLGDSSPSHLMTREAFTAMRRALNEEGTLVINSFGGFDDGRDFLTASIHKTLRSVFPSVRIHASGNGNIFFVASGRSQLEIVHPPDFTQVHPSLELAARSAFDGIRSVDPAHGRVLTDDFNPVEYYDAPNRETWRRQLAFSMKSL